MKSGTAFLAMVFASATFPVLAQQPASQPGTPAAPPASEPATQTESPQAPKPAAEQSAPQQQASPEQGSPAASAEVPSAPLSPVNGELISKLDTKTAKTGDNVEVRTKSAVKTADGTEIPRGSKLMGRVVAVQASASGTNSQVALQFDHIELKGGQSLPVHSQIESISPAGGSATASAADAPGATSAPRAAGPGTMNGTSASSRATGTSQATPSGSSDSAAAPAAGNGPPAAGTVVAKNGNIAIQTTSIPGVLLANNAPGQQDPRMAQASSILLGARKDVQLEGGTQLVVGVSAAGGGAR